MADLTTLVVGTFCMSLYSKLRIALPAAIFALSAWIPAQADNNAEQAKDCSAALNELKSMNITPGASNCQTGQTLQWRVEATAEQFEQVMDVCEKPRLAALYRYSESRIVSCQYTSSTRNTPSGAY